MKQNPAVATLSPETQSVAFRLGPLALQLGLLTGLFLILYGRILVSFAQQWWTQEESSHGFLVLPVCFVILWSNRRELKALPVEPTRRGGIQIMATAGLLLILSEVGGILTLGQFSMLMMLAGLVLTLLGVSFLTSLRFPLSYLLFMLPSLTGAVLVWNWEFQLATARMGVLFLQLLGVPAELDENHIILPNIILRVASSCSGARYLISILALALPLGYLMLRRLRYRIALAVLALFIGIAANWIRVVFIALWAYSGGKVIHGPFHVFQALSVAWMAFAGLFVATWILLTIESRGVGSAVEGEERSQVATGGGLGFSPSWNWAWAQAVFVLLAVFAYLSFYHRGPLPLKRSFAAFPSNIGHWAKAQGNHVMPFPRAVGAEDEVHRVYAGAGNERLHLYVAYFEYQKQGKEAVSHLTAPFHQGARRFLLGCGQSVVGVFDHRFATTNEFEDHQILFWYDINGRILADRRTAKAFTIWDALTRGRTNAAFVMIYRERKPDETQESDSEQLKNFAVELATVLRDFLP